MVTGVITGDFQPFFSFLFHPHTFLFFKPLYQKQKQKKDQIGVHWAIQDHLIQDNVPIPIHEIIPIFPQKV